MRNSWLFLVPLVGLMACGVDSSAELSGDEAASQSEELRKWDPCATVRCAAGTHCVAKGRRAYCVPDEQACTQDSDCRLFDNYCDGCACQALGLNEPEPVCKGTYVQCFAQPCMGKVAVCRSGTCQVESSTVSGGEKCGSVTCPTGQVCCNSSCGICTPPDGFCIQIACL